MIEIEVTLDTRWDSIGRTGCDRRRSPPPLQRPADDATPFLFAHNPVPMWIYDLESLRFLDVNNAAIDLYGHSREQFLSMRITDIRPADEISRLQADLEDRRPVFQRSGTWTHVLADGSKIEVEITSHQTLFDGRSAVLVSAVNLTDRDRRRGCTCDEPVIVLSQPDAAFDPVNVDALRGAIVTGELRVHYQPVFSLDDGTLTGAEALIRWEHPDSGLIMPSAFIPLAEDTGLIGDIWRWLLDDAFQRWAGWGFPDSDNRSISINLSAHQFDDPSTVDDFISAHTSYGLDPSSVVIEITETAVANDPERMLEVLAAFRMLGVRVALDDFGTGYSNLVYLDRMAFDILKIDRTFIERLPTDPRQRAIVSHVVDLAHALGMTVVAEGVETSEQLETLSQLEVDLAQGYYLGRPLESSAFSALL